MQVGLLGSARELQYDLERIASKADTRSPEGLHYILQGKFSVDEGCHWSKRCFDVLSDVMSTLSLRISHAWLDVMIYTCRDGFGAASQPGLLFIWFFCWC